MYNIFGFYKFKKITNIKEKKVLFNNFLKIEKFKGTIILSKEGINGTISFNKDSYYAIKKKIKKFFKIKSFDNENLSNCSFQPFHKGKIKNKKEIVTIGFLLSKKIKK